MSIQELMLTHRRLDGSAETALCLARRVVQRRDKGGSGHAGYGLGQALAYVWGRRQSDRPTLGVEHREYRAMSQSGAVGMGSTRDSRRVEAEVCCVTRDPLLSFRHQCRLFRSSHLDKRATADHVSTRALDSVAAAIHH
jgi:hypothetical protein